MNTYLLLTFVVVISVLITLIVSSQYYQHKLAFGQSLLYESKAETTRLQDSVKILADNQHAREESLAGWEQRIQKEFSVLADAVLERKARQFNDQQEDKLNSMLTPLKETISLFKADIDTKFSEENRDKASLKEEIVKLMFANHSIGKQAQDLSQALKGSFKKQGDWGEGILDSILEYAGLQEGINYIRQAEEKNDQGVRIRPDIKVLLGPDRSLIIDSKVSLTHYWDYCAAETTEVQTVLLQNLVKAVRAHVDSLCEKKYVDIEGTPDFVFMFMPVEPAYMAAMQHDLSLWQYAYSKKILLISPTNLIPAMKMISDMWQRDAVNKNAQAIAQQAARLYDKLAGFIETFERTGSQIASAGKAFEESRKQLLNGRGNLVFQAEKMRGLNLATNKQISQNLIQEALQADNLARFYEDDSESHL